VARQIDEDVDAVGPDPLGKLRVRERLAGDPVIHRGTQAPGHRILQRIAVITGDLDLALVVMHQ
jgi:hypothetical protein